jgi:hypothetical protein
MAAASSLADHVTRLAGAPVAAVGFLGQTPALALDDGNLLLIAPDGQRRIMAHPGASTLAAATAGDKFVTGGDDGCVVATLVGGAIQELANENGKWIDALAACEDGALPGRAARMCAPAIPLVT